MEVKPPHEERTNSNTLSAALLFCLAVACDAATAIDPPKGVADAAASLRSSSLVLVLCLASPGLYRPHQLNYLPDQRLFLIALLAALSFSGLHYGGEGTRGGDAAYVALVSAVVVGVHASGGIEPDELAPDGNAATNRRRTVTSLAAALLCYASLRGLLTAWKSAWEPGEHTLSDTGLLGYALYSPWQSVPLAYGHGVGVVAGAAVLLSPCAEKLGIACLRIEASLCGVLMLASALVVQIGGAEQIDGLPILYGPSACASAREACAEANASRRFSAVIANPASLWITGLGLLVFGFAFETRPSRRQNLQKLQSEDSSRSIVPVVQEAMLTVIVALGVSIVAIWYFGSFEGEALVTELCLLSSLLGAGVALLNGSKIGWCGSLIYVLSSATFQAEFVQTYSFDDTVVHLTHWTLFFSTGCFAVYLVLLIPSVFFSQSSSAEESTLVERCAGCLVCAGSSAAFMLFLASAILTATSSGRIPSNYVKSGKGSATMMAFVLEHFVPLLAWAPGIALRPECHDFSYRTRVAAWAAPLVLVGGGFALYMALTGNESPAFASVEAWSAAACTILAVFAWLLVGLPSSSATDNNGNSSPR